MSEPKFLYKEAIRHGWVMTKKHIKVIFIVGLIYLASQAVGSTLEYFSGGRLEVDEIEKIVPDRKSAQALYAALQQNGYVNIFGKVEAAFTQIASPSELKLPAEFEGERQAMYDLLDKHRYRLPFPKSVYMGLVFLLWVIDTLIAIGVIKAFLMISRDEEPDIRDVFFQTQAFAPYVLATICYGLAIIGGFVLLIIPGFIFMIMFVMYPYLVIDKDLGPIASLKRSRVITKGSRWRILGLWGALLLLNIAGLVCLIVGVFFTLSISYVAMAYVYDRLESGSAAEVEVV
jgi:hypothetical protein